MLPKLHEDLLQAAQDAYQGNADVENLRLVLRKNMSNLTNPAQRVCTV